MGRKLVVSNRGHVQSVRSVSDSNKCKCEQNGQFSSAVPSADVTEQPRINKNIKQQVQKLKKHTTL